MLRRRLPFYSLYLARFASSFGKVTLVTLLPSFINLFDPSGFVIGLFTTALTLGQAAAIVPLGWSGDRFDKRTILLGALAVNVAAYVLFLSVDGTSDFILARALQGVGLVGVGLIGLALIGELAPEDERAGFIGTFNAWRMAAGVAGTLGAGLLYEAGGYDPIFALLAVLVALSLVGVWLFVDPDTSTVRGFAFKDLALNRRIRVMASFRAPYAFAVTLVRNWVPIYVGVSIASGGLGYRAFVVGLVVAAEKFTNMLLQPVTGRLSDRHGREPFIALGGGLYGAIALLIPLAPVIGSGLGLPAQYPLLGTLSPAFLPVLVLNAALGAADSIREPASMALFADEGRGEGIASSFGVRSLIWRPGNIAAPMVGGPLMTGVSMASVFFLGGGVALAGAGLFLLLFRRAKRRRAAVP